MATQAHQPPRPRRHLGSTKQALKEYGVTGGFPLPPKPGTAEYESDAWLKLRKFLAFAMTDEKTFDCNPINHTAWTAGPPGQSIIKEDIRCSTARHNTIKYIITVCPAFGAVLTETLAGTRGRGYKPPPALRYKVRCVLIAA